MAGAKVGVEKHHGQGHDLIQRAQTHLDSRLESFGEILLKSVKITEVGCLYILAELGRCMLRSEPGSCEEAD